MWGIEENVCIPDSIESRVSNVQIVGRLSRNLGIFYVNIV